MYGRNQGFLKTDRGHKLLCTPELVNLSIGGMELYLGKEQQAIDSIKNPSELVLGFPHSTIYKQQSHTFSHKQFI